MREKVMPCRLGYDPHVLTVVLIRPRVAVFNEHRLASKIGRHASVKRIEPLFRVFQVHLPPPDFTGRFRLVHHVLVLGRAPGVLTRGDHQRPQVGDLGLVAAYGVLIEFRGGPVPVNLPKMMQTYMVQLMIRHQVARFHDNLLCSSVSSAPFS
jgi:hypothetical protein